MIFNSIINDMNNSILLRKFKRSKLLFDNSNKIVEDCYSKFFLRGGKLALKKEYKLL